MRGYTFGLLNPACTRPRKSVASASLVFGETVKAARPISCRDEREENGLARKFELVLKQTDLCGAAGKYFEPREHDDPEVEP